MKSAKSLIFSPADTVKKMRNHILGAKYRLVWGGRLSKANTDVPQLIRLALHLSVRRIFLGLACSSITKSQCDLKSRRLYHACVANDEVETARCIGSKPFRDARESAAGWIAPRRDDEAIR